MLSSTDILNTVDALGRPGIRGRVAALRRANSAGLGGMGSDLTVAQQRFLDAAANTTPAAKPNGYAHPAAYAPDVSRVRGDQPLSASELEWLKRLPTDPSQIPYDDARQVFSLRNAVADRGDKLLLDSIAKPLLEHHNREQALVDLANAQKPLPPTPPETLPALADAVAAEADQLQPDEVIARASKMLSEHGQKRQAQRAQRAALAQAAIDKVDSDVAQRKAVQP